MPLMEGELALGIASDLSKQVAGDQPLNMMASGKQHSSEVIQKDFEWIEAFNRDNLPLVISKLEEEKKQAQMKKNPGANTAKKTQQKIMTINYKLTQAKKVKERIDELLQIPQTVLLNLQY